MFFFGPISSSALQSFANKIIFISHKKSFLGRFFITTKINFISQKDFHSDLGQTPRVIHEILFGLFLLQGFQNLVGVKSFIYLPLFYLRFSKKPTRSKKILQVSYVYPARFSKPCRYKIFKFFVKKNL